ncbi:hypothetical protein EYR36_009254 [Pleurotus pulmonarius]|nr:hypothetical protein EYR36_009254 [Pleurotus pulmonarius]KAF4592753.1 hypothetical protein EYR38_008453 [Pleurotus pulmonarius]
MNAFFALDALNFDSQLIGFSSPTVFENDVSEDRLHAAFPAQSLLFSVEPAFAGEPSEPDATVLDFSMDSEISNDGTPFVMNISMDHTYADASAAFEAGPLDAELETVNCFHRIYPRIDDCDDFDAYDSDDASMASSGRSTPLSSFPSTPNNVAMDISEGDIDELQLELRCRKERDIISLEGGLFDKQANFHRFENNFATSLLVPVDAY